MDEGICSGLDGGADEGVDARSDYVAHINRLVHPNHGVNSSVDLCLKSSIKIGTRLVALGGRNGKRSIHTQSSLNSAIDSRETSSIYT